MAVLLAFDDAAVAGQETACAQRFVEYAIIFIERAADAEAYRSGLAGETATHYRAGDVEIADAVDRSERLVDDHAQHGAGKILFEALAVDGDLAVAAFDPYARNGALAPAGAVGDQFLGAA